MTPRTIRNSILCGYICGLGSIFVIKILDGRKRLENKKKLIIISLLEEKKEYIPFFFAK